MVHVLNLLLFSAIPFVAFGRMPDRGSYVELFGVILGGLG